MNPLPRKQHIENDIYDASCAVETVGENRLGIAVRAIVSNSERYRDSSRGPFSSSIDRE